MRSSLQDRQKMRSNCSSQLHRHMRLVNKPFVWLFGNEQQDLLDGGAACAESLTAVFTVTVAARTHRTFAMSALRTLTKRHESFLQPAVAD